MKNAEIKTDPQPTPRQKESFTNRLAPNYHKPTPLLRPEQIKELEDAGFAVRRARESYTYHPDYHKGKDPTLLDWFTGLVVAFTILLLLNNTLMPGFFDKYLRPLGLEYKEASLSHSGETPSL